MAYQLILLGPMAGDAKKNVALSAAFKARIAELGLDPQVDLEILISPAGGNINWSGAPVAIWLGKPDDEGSQSDRELLDRLLDLPAPVFPVVEDLSHFTKAVPPKLKPFNGVEWLTATQLPKLVADLLRAMRLTRVQRKAFISYKRDKTLGVARQLFAELAHRGYQPFLDTASVPSAADFQETLWTRMADVDLVILLDAPGTLDSNWVYLELNRAHALSLAVLQLVWPTPRGMSKQFTGSPGTEFCERYPLDTTNFTADPMTPGAELDRNVVEKVAAAAEEARIRSLFYRRKKVVGEVMDQAARHSLSVKHYPPDAQRYPSGAIELLRNNKEIGWVIPLVGLPDALAIFDHETLLKPATDWKPYVIAYDGLGISPDWAKHIDWLNERERLAAKPVDNLETWMGRL